MPNLANLTRGRTFDGRSTAPLMAHAKVDEGPVLRTRASDRGTFRRAQSAADVTWVTSPGHHFSLPPFVVVARTCSNSGWAPRPNGPGFATSPPPSGLVRIVAARGPVRLHGRTRHVTERAEHAAVAGLRSEHRSAALAVVEVLAGVGRHRFPLSMSARWAGDRRLQNKRHISLSFG